MASTVMTPIGFIYAPALFEAKANPQNPNQEPRFSMLLVFDDPGVNSSAYQDLKKAVFEAIAEKFGAAKAKDPNFVRGLRLPFRDATEKSYLDWTASATRLRPPRSRRALMTTSLSEGGHGAAGLGSARRVFFAWRLT